MNTTNDKQDLWSRMAAYRQNLAILYYARALGALIDLYRYAYMQRLPLLMALAMWMLMRMPQVLRAACWLGGIPMGKG